MASFRYSPELTTALRQYRQTIAYYQNSVRPYHLKQIRLSEYVGFKRSDILRYPDAESALFAVRFRRQQIEELIRDEKTKVNSRHGRGLNKGELLAMRLSYNHGHGAYYMGYFDTDANFEPADPFDDFD